MPVAGVEKFCDGSVEVPPAWFSVAVSRTVNVVPLDETEMRTFLAPFTWHPPGSGSRCVWVDRLQVPPKSKMTYGLLVAGGPMPDSHPVDYRALSVEKPGPLKTRLPGHKVVLHQVGHVPHISTRIIVGRKRIDGRCNWV